MFDTSMAAQRSGARLAYVIVMLEGSVERIVTRYKPKEGLVTELKKEPAGYMVYFPRGHVVRFRTKADLREYGLDPENVPICNMKGLHDPKSAIGKLLTAQDDATRKGAWTKLEDQVIRLATAKTGTILMPEQMAREQAAA